MMKVVLDTNILVSALWKRHSNPAQILSLVLTDALAPCFDADVMLEYKAVLRRPKLAFHFVDANVDEILAKIYADGLSVTVMPSSIPFADGNDRKFYDVAKTCGAYLITGNKKHYPDEPFIVSPAEFLQMLESEG